MKKTMRVLSGVAVALGLVLAALIVVAFSSGCHETLVDLGNCQTSEDCDDGQPCTTDICDGSNHCQHAFSGDLQCLAECIGRTEVCNGYDDDCDNAIDEGCPCEGEPHTIYVFRECGFGPPPANYCSYGTQYCTADDVYSECLGGNPRDGEEYCSTSIQTDGDCDGLMNYEDPDCEPECTTDADCSRFDGECLVFRCLANSCFAYERDDDGDGRSLCGGLPEGERYDCDDTDPTVFPGAEEVCGGVDDDCDGETDEGLPAMWRSCYSGGDHCTFDGTRFSCVGECRPGIFACIDSVVVCLGEVQPVTEVCDGADNDCDGDTDEGLLVMFYLDNDRDGYGDPAWLVGYTCPDRALPNWAANRGDCNDSDAEVHARDGCPPCEVTYYRDADSDGFGDPAHGEVFSCDDESVVGNMPTIGDCDDTDSAVHNGADEVCDGLDNDCDTVVDEDCP